MGLTAGLVKTVFSKNRSHDTNVRNSLADKKRWSTVRSYLCGDDCNSALADAGSASITTTSDATVLQDAQTENRDEQAAMVIQSAFRRFQARREYEERKLEEKSPTSSEESLGSSVQVETGGGSVETLSLKEERLSVQRAHQKARPSHNAKLKEDWDDSTVSSNVLKSRIQSRLEATTRRERALAYAFSQQLRVCSKKKPTQSEVNMGWSWLERWMATRPLETFSLEDRMSRQDEPGHLFAGIRRKNFEEESCASNEVSLRMNHLTITAPDDNGYHHNKPGKNRLKAAKTAPSYQISPRTQGTVSSRKLENKENKSEHTSPDDSASLSYSDPQRTNAT